MTVQPGNIAYGQWGRAAQAKLQTSLQCFSIITFAPLLVFYFYISAFEYSCSLFTPITNLFVGYLTLHELWSKLPAVSWEAYMIFFGWFGLQLLLALIPDRLHDLMSAYRGGQHLGSVTPTGHRLEYNINGLQAWCIAHLLFLLGAFYWNWFSPTILFDHWGQLLWLVNVTGFSLAIFVYLKAYLFPSFVGDRKFSGNNIYDFYMGIELNPRIGPIDCKLFFNGRPGIVAWTLINISFAAAQHQRYGYITNSMVIVNVLQALYVLYFFWKEEWYLNTIDIHHDHFGWMLAWGDCVWLPYMYTLQALFLVYNPIELSASYAIFVLGLGLFGFWIFFSSNNQKDRFRQRNSQTLIWKKKPSFISCQYTTQDGLIREGRLLTSGWWGMTRHMNYTGDLILSLAYSLACGFSSPFPYFYFIFMAILLIHRCLRDEHRCLHKYGKGWEQYCSQVPYRLIPKVF